MNRTVKTLNFPSNPLFSSDHRMEPVYRPAAMQEYQQRFLNVSRLGAGKEDLGEKSEKSSKKTPTSTAVSNKTTNDKSSKAKSVTTSIKDVKKGTKSKVTDKTAAAPVSLNANRSPEFSKSFNGDSKKGSKKSCKRRAKKEKNSEKSNPEKHSWRLKDALSFSKSKSKSKSLNSEKSKAPKEAKARKGGKKKLLLYRRRAHAGVVERMPIDPNDTVNSFSMNVISGNQIGYDSTGNPTTSNTALSVASLKYTPVQKTSSHTICLWVAIFCALAAEFSICIGLIIGIILWDDISILTHVVLTICHIVCALTGMEMIHRKSKVMFSVFFIANVFCGFFSVVYIVIQERRNNAVQSAEMQPSKEHISIVKESVKMAAASSVIFVINTVLTVLLYADCHIRNNASNEPQCRNNILLQQSDTKLVGIDPKKDAKKDEKGSKKDEKASKVEEKSSKKGGKTETDSKKDSLKSSKKEIGSKESTVEDSQKNKDSEKDESKKNDSDKEKKELLAQFFSTLKSYPWTAWLKGKREKSPEKAETPAAPVPPTVTEKESKEAVIKVPEKINIETPAKVETAKPVVTKPKEPVEKKKPHTVIPMENLCDKTVEVNEKTEESKKEKSVKNEESGKKEDIKALVAFDEKKEEKTQKTDDDIKKPEIDFDKLEINYNARPVVLTPPSSEAPTQFR